MSTDIEIPRPSADSWVRNQLHQWEMDGFGDLSICMPNQVQLYRAL